MPQPPAPAIRPAVFRVDIPLLAESAVGNALQFIDLLRNANLLAGLRKGGEAPSMQWRLVDAEGLPLPTGPGPLAAYAPGGDAQEPSHALFIPSIHAPDIPAIRSVAARHGALAQKIGVALDAGQKLLTVGNGAWLAARSGRLDGRTASLPWFYIPGFARDFPTIGLNLEEEISEDGPWLSCALPQNVNGLAIGLVRHAFGDELAATCASVMTFDRQRMRAALQANAQQYIPLTRDSTLAKAIAWMEAHLDEPYSLSRLANAASVSTRTLLRHFQQEFRESPLDHLHGLRCARARILLEMTLESVSSIAAACGYADPAAFRRVFARHAGMAPSEYRKSHALRAPRRRWRVDVASHER